MSEHTPTPWYEAKDGIGSGIFAKSGEHEVLVVSGFDDGYPQDPPIRARIVACVNAFHSPDGRKIATEDIAEGTFWNVYRFMQWVAWQPCTCAEDSGCMSCQACDFMESLKVQEPEK